MATAASADAAVWCHDDPIVPIGLPITYNLNPVVRINLGRHWIQLDAIASGNRNFQRIAADLGLG
ncbi:MAG: hypothetical protein ACREPA_06625 [Candidatus Dormibacteraceae bacterium]